MQQSLVANIEVNVNLGVDFLEKVRMCEKELMVYLKFDNVLTEVVISVHLEGELVGGFVV